MIFECINRSTFNSGYFCTIHQKSEFKILKKIIPQLSIHFSKPMEEEVYEIKNLRNYINLIYSNQKSKD